MELLKLFLIFIYCVPLIINMVKFCFCTNLTDCGSEGTLNYINFTGCKNSSEEACRIERGTNGTFTVEFTPAEDAYALRVKATGLLGALELPLNIKTPDGCLVDGITCPILANSNQTYIADIHISSSLPQISADVRWQIQNEENKNIVCVQFPVELC